MVNLEYLYSLNCFDNWFKNEYKGPGHKFSDWVDGKISREVYDNAMKHYGSKRNICEIELKSEERLREEVKIRY